MGNKKLIKQVLLTGGTGYIGSHTCLNLLEKGYKVLVLDSCINSSEKSLERVIKIIKEKKINFKDQLKFIKGDLKDLNLLNQIFQDCENSNKSINSVIHFAGLKALDQSIKNPLQYWDSNVSGTINLLKVMNKFNCKKIIFSSSASIYEYCKNKKIKEKSNINPSSPYGSTKATIEKLLYDLYQSALDEWGIINLRYFNPIGAHDSGLIGEYSLSNTNNIFPILCDVALGEKKEIKIFGGDWDTPDGTCIRDYIHVMDLSEAHVLALEYLMDKEAKYLSLNIGTSKGTSVLELINTFQKVNDVKINYSIIDRRQGDNQEVVADCTLARKILNWVAKRSLTEMCRDGWKWKTLNPKGY